MDWANLLCVTDHPQQTGNALGRRVLEDSQLLHAKLPPLLVRYLLAGEPCGYLVILAIVLYLPAFCIRY